MSKSRVFPENCYLLGKPPGTGTIKQSIEDFIVTEDLGYVPTGEGEHIFLWVEKRGLNTAFVAEQIAKQTGLALRDVTYAGRKDKFALTRQWFGLHAPKGLPNALDSLHIEGATVLNTTRHNKKLRVGNVKSNKFKLVLRNIEHADTINTRLEKIASTGVPNYFGDQRFGVLRSNTGETQYGGTLALAMRMVEGEAIRNRNKRNMAISALRSAMFNAFVSKRIEQNLFTEVQKGDACILLGSRSFFIENGDTLIESQQRYEENDLSPSAPLLGVGQRATTHFMADWERSLEEHFARIIQCLQKEGVKTLRREIKLMPQNLSWEFSGNNLQLDFSLPSGCFATSVLRECIALNETQESGSE